MIETGRNSMVKQPPDVEPGVAAPLFLSFAWRSGPSGGAIAARGFERVARIVLGESLCSVYQDEPAGVRAVGDLLLRVTRRSNPAMAMRLIATGDIGRHKFRVVHAGTPRLGVSMRPLVVDGVGHASALRHLRAHFRPVVMIHQNFEPDYYADLYDGRWQKPWMVRAGYRAEALCARLAHVNFFVTTDDLERFQRAFPDAAVTCHHLGVQEESDPLPPAVDRGAGPLRVLVTGAMTDRKGVVGLVDFLKCALASRANLKKRLRVVVVGRGAPESIRALADGEFIELHQDVPDIAPIARGCDVYVNPNYTGSGIKLRNLDGLRHGLPVFCRVENAAGFREMSSVAFQTVTDSAECLDRLCAIDHADVRSDALRLAVWEDYRRHFSFDVGVERFRRGLARFERA